MHFTGTGLCLELKRAGVGRTVNRYGLCFGFEEVRPGACSYQVSVRVWSG